MRTVINNYPQWFIDDLFNEEDKERARLGTLKKSEKVEFSCNRNHIYKQIISNHINSEGLRKSFCPICTKIDRQLNRKYPEWFINELINEEDKQKALSGSLTSCDRVKIKCTKCGYEYETKVGTHIVLETMEQRRGCKECAREKHRQDKINYIKENYEKVCISNRKTAELLKEYFRNNPEKLKERGKKRSLYLKEHPEIVENFVTRMKEWRDTHPEEVLENTEKLKLWMNEHKEEFSRKVSEAINSDVEGKKRRADKYRELCRTTDLRKRLSESIKKLYQEHPEKAIEQGKKVSEWYKSNPDKVKKKAQNYSAYLQTHSEIRKRISDKLKDHYKNEEWKSRKYRNISKARYNRRFNNITDSFKDSLKSILHPEDYESFLSGEIVSKSMVRVKCPICSSYSKHLLYNVCSIENNRIDSTPLCESCLGQLNSSKKEKEIRDYIETFYKGEVIENNRDIIPPYELDLYYPEKNIAIEYNGAYWHSDIHKKKTFHYQKFFLCKQLGIRLLSVYSQDWEYKRDKVEQILKSAFSKSCTLYARDCTVQEISKEDRISFLSSYHFDEDYNHAIYSYGLFHNGTLLAVMSFGGLRGNNSKCKNPNYYELIRLAFRAGYRVIGGVSKLFSHFVRDYDPQYILSYSDNDYFTGEVYRNLGFTLVSYGEKSLDYQWVKYKSVLNRYSCTVESLLKKYPKYRDVKIEGSVEDYIMRDLGYNKVYRCGNSKWEWFNE